MTIVGLDIGKHGNAVACPLSAMPENILHYHDNKNTVFLALTPSKQSIKDLLYIWCMARICPSPPRRLDTEIGDKLGAKWDTMKRKKKAKGKDAIIRLCFYATRLLFNELKHTIVF